MPIRLSKILGLFAALVVLGALGFLRFRGGSPSEAGEAEERVAAVEVAAVERRALDLERTLSGALEARAEFVVAPKVGGRVERLTVDLADTVERGQLVAVLDEAEFAQDVKQAEAELAVAQANQVQAENALQISGREHQRIVSLRERGIASDSELDLTSADLMAKEAQLAIAKAQVIRAQAALESSRIRHGYTQVTADWTEGDATRVVAERYVDAGETVSANQALLLIVQLDPIVAVISVTERDYGRLRPGLEAQFEVDAFPGEIFRGRIERIAPVFRETSRQARVELSLANPDYRLKPGMFIRAVIALDRVDDAVAVPESALTRRGDVEGVFLVTESGDRVRWVPVQPGIRSGGWVELKGASIDGRVVTLGQHLISDGSAVTIATALQNGAGP